jgi:hypothetical protein
MCVRLVIFIPLNNRSSQKKYVVRTRANSYTRVYITLANRDFQYLLLGMISIGRFKIFITLNIIKPNLLLICFI